MFEHCSFRFTVGLFSCNRCSVSQFLGCELKEFLHSLSSKEGEDDRPVAKASEKIEKASLPKASTPKAKAKAAQKQKAKAKPARQGAETAADAVEAPAESDTIETKRDKTAKPASSKAKSAKAKAKVKAASKAKGKAKAKVKKAKVEEVEQEKEVEESEPVEEPPMKKPAASASKGKGKGKPKRKAAKSISGAYVGIFSPWFSF